MKWYPPAAFNGSHHLFTCSTGGHSNCGCARNTIRLPSGERLGVIPGPSIFNFGFPSTLIMTIFDLLKPPAVIEESHHVLLPIPPVTSTSNLVGLELAGTTPSSDRAQMYSEKTRDLGAGHDCVLARPLLSRRACHHTLSSCRAGSRFERYP